MKQINEMNEAELIYYFVDKRVKGATSREIAQSLERYNIPQETRVKIMEIIKEAKVLKEKDGLSGSKLAATLQSIQYFGLGALIIGAGVVLYKLTAKVGVFPTIEIPIAFLGVLCIVKGIVAAVVAYKR